MQIHSWILKWPQIAKKRKKDTLPGFQSDCKSEKGEKQIQIRRQEVTVLPKFADDEFDMYISWKNRKADTFPTPVSDRKSQKGEN